MHKEDSNVLTIGGVRRDRATLLQQHPRSLMPQSSSAIAEGDDCSVQSASSSATMTRSNRAKSNGCRLNYSDQHRVQGAVVDAG
eukprot:8611277-Ditylum_brightwellii.AAC.1